MSAPYQSCKWGLKNPMDGFNRNLLQLASVGVYSCPRRLGFSFFAVRQ